MAAHDAFFYSSVSHFADKNHATLARLFDVSENEVTTSDLVQLLEHSIGEQMKAYFERKGRFDTDILKELALVPPAERSITALAPRVARKEFGMAMNKPIHQAKMINPKYGAALDQLIVLWRRNRMRKEMESLAACSKDIEAYTLRLLSALDRFRDQPNFENRLRVKAAMSHVNKSLLRAHRRARIGAVWALRSGYSSEAVSKAIHRLYLKRMRNLTTGMARLDHYIGKHGIQSHIATGIQRRQKILTRELMNATASPELYQQKTRYANRQARDILGDLSYG